MSLDFDNSLAYNLNLIVIILVQFISVKPMKTYETRYKEKHKYHKIKDDFS